MSQNDFVLSYFFLSKVSTHETQPTLGGQVVKESTFSHTRSPVQMCHHPPTPTKPFRIFV